MDKSKECIKCENFVLDLDEVPCCFCEDKSNFKLKEMKLKSKEVNEKNDRNNANN